MCRPDFGSSGAGKLGGAFNGEFHNRLGGWRGRGLDRERNNRGDLFTRGVAKILIKREQSEGLELTERAAELLLDPVNLVKECPAIHLQPAAAELPIGAQQEMKFEDLVLLFIQSAAAHQAEIGDVLLVFQPPDGFPLAARVCFQGNAADIFLL